MNALSIDVEDWFHILDCPSVPPVEQWDLLESRVERNVEILLQLLDDLSVKATFFWLGWVAERRVSLVRRCYAEGHEIASHGSLHVPHEELGSKLFMRDITRAKAVLEDIVGEEVTGFRAPGCLVGRDHRWAFEVIKEAGYEYDSSVFPVCFSGNNGSVTGPHRIPTASGPLLEIPPSVVQIFGVKWSFFCGGYLRLAPTWLIRWGIRRLENDGLPLVVYVHPREIDPSHPRLPLSALRRFRCYVNLRSTLPKLEWLCKEYRFVPLCQIADRFSEC